MTDDSVSKFSWRKLLNAIIGGPFDVKERLDDLIESSTEAEVDSDRTNATPPREGGHQGKDVPPVNPHLLIGIPENADLGHGDHEGAQNEEQDDQRQR